MSEVFLNEQIPFRNASILLLCDAELNFLLDNMVYNSDLKGINLLDDDEIDELMRVKKESDLELLSMENDIKQFAEALTSSDFKLPTLEEKTNGEKENNNSAPKVKISKKFVLDRIHRKMDNIKRFFPDLYSNNESIITMWTNCGVLENLKLKVLGLKDWTRNSPWV